VDQEDKTERRYCARSTRVRYGYESDRSIERAVADGHLPKPDLYMAAFRSGRRTPSMPTSKSSARSGNPATDSLPHRRLLQRRPGR